MTKVKDLQVIYSGNIVIEHYNMDSGVAEVYFQGKMSDLNEDKYINLLSADVYHIEPLDKGIIADICDHDVIAVPDNKYFADFIRLYAKFKAEKPDPDVRFTLQEHSDGMSISIHLEGNKESAWYAKCHNNGRISGSSSLRQRDTAYSYHLFSFLRKHLDISNDYQESFADTEDPRVYFTATIKDNHD